MKAYSEYKDSGVEWLGKVPAGWEVLDLKHVCYVFPSNVDKHTHPDETPIRLCNYTDVYYNDRITRDLDFMQASATESEIEKFTLSVGDVIFTKDSETADDIGIAAIVTEELPGVICGYHLSIARPNDGIEGRFIKYFFDSRAAKGYFAVSANGLTRVGLGQSAINNLQLAVPPLSEQRKIAAFLDLEVAKIDDLIEEQRRLIALLAEKRQATISHAVTKGLNPNAKLKPSGIDWLGDVPEGWEQYPLRHICEIMRGKFTHRPRNDPAFYDGDYPFVQTGDIAGAGRYVEEFKQTLNERGASVSKQFPAGTLVMTIAANLGDVSILKFDAYFPDSIVGLLPKSGMKIDYLYYLMIALKPALLTNATVSTQLNINTDQISSIVGLQPPIPVQNEIVDFLDKKLAHHNLMTLAAAEMITLLQERRSALISAAVTGKIDLRDFDDSILE